MTGIDFELVADRYIAVWNERDGGRRRELIAETWTEDGSYLDPMMRGDGAEGIDAMIGGAQEQFPGHAFRRLGPSDAHADRLRFSWVLTPTAGGAAVVAGTDFGVVAPDGRLRTVTGFLDQPPAPQEIGG